MRCPYVYPREEDWRIASIVESLEPALVAGVRGSGVSTALERASRLSARRPPLARGLGEALERCRGGSYVIADLAPGEVEGFLGSCRGLAGASGGLAWLAREAASIARSVEVVVLKPLSPPEALDYLAVLGVSLEDDSLAEEVVLRTGGMPGDLCRLAIEGGWRGRRIGRRDVEALGEAPQWLVEARREMGLEFDELVTAAALGALTEGLARELGLDTGRPWLRPAGGGLYTIWPELLWLQPFAARLLGPRELERLYAAAEAHPLPGYVKYTHASLLYKMTGRREYAEKALRYGPEAYRAFDSPVARARVAATLAEAARRLGAAREELKWLARLANDAPGPLSSSDYAEAVQRGRRAYAITGDAPAYLDLLSSLARRAAAERRLEELEFILDEMEALHSRDPRHRRLIEAHYLTADALRSAALGDWASAARSLEEALSSGAAPPSARLLAVVARVMLGDTRGARRLLEESRGSLEPGDAEYLEALIRFMERRRPPRPRGVPPRDPRVALLDSLARASRGLEAEPPDPDVAPVVRALARAARGDVEGAYWEMKPLLEEGAYTPLHLLADVLTTLAQARSDPAAREAARSVLSRLAAAAEAGGNGGLAGALRDAADAAARGDWEEAFWAAARAALVVVYMVG